MRKQRVEICTSAPWIVMESHFYHCGGTLCSLEAGWRQCRRQLQNRKLCDRFRTMGTGAETASSFLCFSAQAGFPDVGAELVGVLFGRGNPSPNPFGLCTAWTGSEIPLPSLPRPDPGVQPILWSMRFPMLLSRIGWAFSPTIPEMRTWQPIGEDLPRAEKLES